MVVPISDGTLDPEPQSVRAASPHVMYEAVRVAADGVTTPARFAHTAARYGFDGLVYRTTPDHTIDELDRIRSATGIDLAYGVEVTATDRENAGQTVRQLRSTVDVLCMRATSRDLQRFVAEQEEVDVLGWPLGEGDPLPDAVVRSAAANGVYVELDVGPVLRARGERRQRAIRDLEHVGRIVDHFDVPVVVSGRPSTHLELRSPRELRALAQTIDLPQQAIEHGLQNWGAILERTRRVRSDTFIEPGVREVSNETNDR